MLGRLWSRHCGLRDRRHNDGGLAQRHETLDGARVMGVGRKRWAADHGSGHVRSRYDHVGGVSDFRSLVTITLSGLM
jgi:hypothetical protein